jgi:hypothetical protein
MVEEVQLVKKLKWAISRFLLWMVFAPGTKFDAAH